MGSVFNAKRKIDNKKVIAKMIKPRDEFSPKTAEMVYNEVALMTMNKCDFIVECYDSLEYNEMLWMFVEPMTGDIEKIIQHCK